MKTNMVVPTNNNKKRLFVNSANKAKYSCIAKKIKGKATPKEVNEILKEMLS